MNPDSLVYHITVNPDSNCLSFSVRCVLTCIVLFVFLLSFSRYRQRPSRPQPWRPERNGGRRGKRIRRQGSSTTSNSQPSESIGFPRKKLSLYWFLSFFIFLFFNLIVCVSHTPRWTIYIFHAAKIVDLFFFFIFKALIVSAGSSGYTDLVFGVQWSWTEAEERAEQLQGLSDCVSRRLDQGTIP